jgi:hypothetical protein
MILLFFFNLVFSSSWQNTIFGNEHNSKSYADGNIAFEVFTNSTVGPPIKNTTWVTDIYFRSNSTTLEPLGYGIGPSYVVMFFLSVLKTNINDPSTWYVSSKSIFR